jgi:hypothetical protein
MVMANSPQVRYFLAATLALAAATAGAQQSAAGAAGPAPAQLQAEPSPQLARHDAAQHPQHPQHPQQRRRDGVVAAASAGLSREQVRAEYLLARQNGSIAETEGDYDVAQTRRHVVAQGR